MRTVGGCALLLRGGAVLLCGDAHDGDGARSEVAFHGSYPGGLAPIDACTTGAYGLFAPSSGLVVAVVALFVALRRTSFAVISTSTVPDAQGVFHAYVNPANGAIRMVTGAGQHTA